MKLMYYLICNSGTDERRGAPQEYDKYNTESAATLFLGDVKGVDVYTFATNQAKESQELKHSPATISDADETSSMQPSAIEKLTGNCIHSGNHFKFFQLYNSLICLNIRV